MASRPVAKFTRVYTQVAAEQPAAPAKDRALLLLDDHDVPRGAANL